MTLQYISPFPGGQGSSVHVPAALQRGVQPAPLPLGAHGGAARGEAGPVPARLHLRQPGVILIPKC